MADVVLRWCTDVLVVNDIVPLFGRNYAMQSDSVMVVYQSTWLSGTASRGRERWRF